MLDKYFTDLNGRLPELSVSRETIELLSEYHKLLKKWQKTINLVGPQTLKDFWERHIVDSLQLVSYINISDEDDHIIDLGSGGGLPGIVIAIALRDTKCKVTLIEQDKRKAAFLKTVIRQLNLNNAKALSKDFNQGKDLLKEGGANIITARAVTDLHSLYGIALKFLDLSSPWKMVFPKGKKWETELNDLLANHDVSACKYFLKDSLTDPLAKIIVLESKNNFDK